MPKKRKSLLMPRQQTKKARKSDISLDDSSDDSFEDSEFTSSNLTRNKAAPKSRKVIHSETQKKSDTLNGLDVEPELEKVQQAGGGYLIESAQSVEVPKPKRGRPRKNAVGVVSTSTTRKTTKPTSKIHATKVQKNEKLSSTLITSLPEAFKTVSPTATNGLQLFRPPANKEFEIPGTPRISNISSPLKVQNPDTFLRDSLNGDKIEYSDPPSRSILETIAGGKTPHQSSRDARNLLPMFTQSLINQTYPATHEFPPTQTITKNNDEELRDAAMRTPTPPRIQNARNIINGVYNNDKKADKEKVPRALKKRKTKLTAPIHDSPASDSDQDEGVPAQYPFSELLVPINQEEDDKNEWKQKYEALLKLRFTEPEQMLQDHIAKSKKNDDFIRSLQEEQERQQKALMQEESRKWQEVIQNIEDLKQLVLIQPTKAIPSSSFTSTDDIELQGPNTRAIETTKAEILNTLRSSFNSFKQENLEMIERVVANSSRSLTASFKEPENKDVEMLRKDIRQLHRTLESNIQANIPEALSGSKSDGAQNTLQEVQNTLHLLSLLCGITVTKIDYLEIETIYTCSHKGRFGELQYNLSIENMSESTANPSGPPSKAKVALKINNISAAGNFSVTYSPISTPVGLKTLKKLPPYFQEDLVFESNAVGPFFWKITQALNTK